MSRQGDRSGSASRVVGVVVAVTPTGQLTVRANGSSFVPEGTPVADASHQLRGRVVRVFGPVVRPYLSVRLRRAPTLSEGTRIIGQELVREPRGTHATG